MAIPTPARRSRRVSSVAAVGNESVRSCLRRRGGFGLSTTPALNGALSLCLRPLRRLLWVERALAARLYRRRRRTTIANARAGSFVYAFFFLLLFQLSQRLRRSVTGRLARGTIYANLARRIEAFSRVSASALDRPLLLEVSQTSRRRASLFSRVAVVAPRDRASLMRRMRTSAPIRSSKRKCTRPCPQRE